MDHLVFKWFLQSPAWQFLSGFVHQQILIAYPISSAQSLVKRWSQNAPRTYAAEPSALPHPCQQHNKDNTLQIQFFKPVLLLFSLRLFKQTKQARLSQCLLIKEDIMVSMVVSTHLYWVRVIKNYPDTGSQNCTQGCRGGDTGISPLARSTSSLLEIALPDRLQDHTFIFTVPLFSIHSYIQPATYWYKRF